MSWISQTPTKRVFNTGSTAAGSSNPNLTEFLRSCKLSQYYNDFLTSGASEDDVPMLLDFADNEISELCSAIPLKPFHTVSFKRGLRILKEQLGITPPQMSLKSTPSDAHSTPIAPFHSVTSPTCTNTVAQPIHKIPTPISISPEVVERFQPEAATTIIDTKSPVYPSATSISTVGSEKTGNPNEDLIIERATIYGRKSGRSLTNYEKSMNDAAIAIALAEPTLILNRGQLIEKSKAKLLQDGYVYSRGRSRSKLVRAISNSDSIQEPQAINGTLTPVSSDLGGREEDSSSTSDKEHQAIMSGKARRRTSREQDDGESDTKMKNKKHKFDKEKDWDKERDGEREKERDLSLRGILQHDDDN
ncbi:hypothetical protein K7432_011621 [Basidiobolus ranarum]|uniref:Uncharacterized protein n=1 Tax=Basidiobolus ranarum TaxID=34480 RepID=A0ABR2VTI1_9FUNG